jgi:hypothetical protein
MIHVAGCGKKDDSTTTEDPSQARGTGGASDGPSDHFPQVGTISLAKLGALNGASFRLDGDDRQCDQGDLGIMGLALGGACHTSPMVAEMLLGSMDGDHNGDGKTDCDDLTYAKANDKEAGIMLNLLCEDVMVQNDSIVSLGFEEDNEIFGISFADFENGTSAAGSWTQGNAASYPADIRIWNGASFEAPNGIVSLGLADVNNGKVQVQFSEDGMGLAAAIEYSNKTSTSDCASNPSKDTCHWQDIRLHFDVADEANGEGPPDGFNLRIMADDKKDASFFALEGKYRYTAESAAAFFQGGDDNPCGSVLANVRTIYYQVVQKGSEISGRFFFRDQNEDLLSCPMETQGGTVDIFQMVSAEDGFCQELGSNEPGECSVLNFEDYAAVWQGETAVENITESPVVDVWETGAPESVGICTLEGCRSF